MSSNLLVRAAGPTGRSRTFTGALRASIDSLTTRIPPIRSALGPMIVTGSPRPNRPVTWLTPAGNSDLPCRSAAAAPSST